MNAQSSLPLQPPDPLAVIYGRVSTSLQVTSTQESRGKEYLAWKKFPLAGEFYDDDVSGTVPIWQRPKGRALRQRLESGDIKHLVVAKLDRLGRSAVDLLQTVKFLDSIGVILHIVDLGGDSLSSQGASGRLMFTVLAGMAEYERELITSRINDRMAVKRAAGQLCGKVPYGFDAELTGETTAKGVKIHRLVPNPEEQKWILHMVRLRGAGLGYHSIAKDLNAHGVPTKNRGKMMNLLREGCTKDHVEQKFTSGQWQSGNVESVLNNVTVQNWLQSLATTEAAVA